MSSSAHTAACRELTAAEAAALTNFVTVVDFQLSLPPLEDEFAAQPSSCGSPQSAAALSFGAAFGAAFSGSDVSAAGGACQMVDSACVSGGAPQPVAACTPPQPSGESAADFLAQACSVAALHGGS